ncbi:MAG: HAMP domain-containing histidine kinase [Flammeovirgaceae bacterium]|nr:MAG: HAMP domain-containing histidine kinase [Flammeovirgaceae bacterium]
MREFLKDKINRVLLVLLSVSFVLGLVLINQPGPDSAQIASIIQRNLEQLLVATDHEVNAVAAQLNANPDALITTKLTNQDFFLIRDNEIVRWTSSLYWPPVRVLTDGLPLHYFKVGAGEFLCKRYAVGDDHILAAVIPLQKKYRIQNEYLVPWQNKAVFSGHTVELYDPSSQTGAPVTVKGYPLFNVAIAGQVFRAGHQAAVGALLLGIVLYCAVLIRFAGNNNNKPGKGFLLLTAGLLCIRFVMLYVQFPARYVSSPLFDPKYFASSGFNPNLGDLLFNSACVFVLCLYLFLSYSRFEGLHTVLGRPGYRVLIKAFSATAIVFGFLYPFVVTQTIYNNSAITLAVSESISFGLLRWSALICVLLSWLSAFMFVHVFIRLLGGSKPLWHFFSYLLNGIVVFIFVNELSGQYYLTPLLVALVYLAVVTGWRFDHSLLQVRYATFGYFLIAVLAFAAVTFSAVARFGTKDQVRNQLQFASDFLLERDNFGEYLLDEASKKIETDAFIQARLSGPFSSKEAVKQKIRQVFLPGYFNKYVVDIKLFSGNGDPLDEPMIENFSTWLGRFDAGAAKTEYPNIYFINSGQAETGIRYISLIRISRSEFTVGFVAISLSLRKVIPENVYPELLVDNRFQRSFRVHDYSYAVFHKQQVLFGSGAYNYNRFDGLGNPALFNEGLVLNGFRHVAAEDSEGRVAVVSKKVPSLIYRLADFSFLLICGLALLLLFLLSTGLNNLLRGRQFSFTERIQLILNFSFFMPLITVSLVTLGLTSRSAQEQLNAEYLSKSRNIVEALAAQASGSEAIELENRFIQQLKLANLDANLYNPAGYLMASTQPLIFEYQLLAPVIPPQAYDRITSGEGAFVLQEQVGRLRYYVAYAGMLNAATGKLQGIVAIPYFQSQDALEAMLITILANILIIFTVLFLVLLVVSFLASSWLTRPLRMITRQIGRVSLTESNQPINWLSTDEIGLLVREYNQMLIKLSESKVQLERTQRERTWREIAQQVAHEIKNPLTPMKLTLQQLERTRENELSDRMKASIALLLAQIDTLDGIAASFSTFAKMPEPVLVPVDLVVLLKETCALHQQTGTVHFETRLVKAVGRADRQLLGRAVSNLILNALQAERPDEKVAVTVQLEEENGSYRITVADNGAGVDVSIRDKIFLPHFSTKQSGSGLGLAIVRQSIEQMGGKIWFESEVGRGTRFYIVLPKN